MDIPSYEYVSCFVLAISILGYASFMLNNGETSRLKVSGEEISSLT